MDARLDKYVQHAPVCNLLAKRCEQFFFDVSVATIGSVVESEVYDIVEVYTLPFALYIFFPIFVAFFENLWNKLLVVLLKIHCIYV